MGKRLTLFILAMVLSTGAFCQTSLEGKVTEDSNGMPVPFATVALYKDGTLLTGGDTDFDGNFFFSDIDPGTYDVEISFIGFATNKITGVIVKGGKVNKVDAKMIEEGVLMEKIVITEYKVPMVEFDNTTQGNTITAEDIRALPVKNIGALASTSAGLSSVDGGDISIRGSRDNSTFYYIDGIRVNAETANNQISQAEIDQLQVITGGIEAKYGDVTGGIISITTKGPSSSYSGGFEVETSEFLDAYGYNLANANVSGPILKNKDGESVLGFRLFGQYQYRKDDDPAARGEFRVSEALIDSIESNPVTTFNGSRFPTGEFLTLKDAEEVKTRPNEDDTDINFTGKLDARLSKNVDLTLTGGYYNSANRFSPSEQWDLLNWINNPYSDRNGYRANFRVRHKLGNQSYGLENDEEKATSLIRNASYSLQVGYEKIFEGLEDFRHEDRLFNYGYYGNQAREWQAQATPITNPDAYEGETVDIFGVLWGHQGYTELLGEYTPDLNTNKALSQSYQLNGFDDDLFGEVWGLHDGAGQVYNRFSKEEEDRYTVNLNLGFDLFPGESDEGKHNLQFGFMYEQRIKRLWNIAPRGLWTLARLQANRHLETVDTQDSIGTFIQNVGGQDVLFTQYQTFNQADEFPDNQFFRKVREQFADITINDYINVDGLTPDQLSLDMFSAGELNDRGLINYYGFDHLGNKVGGDIAFNDFFSGRDENGIRDFKVAPLQPIYAAGYIQDKFTYKDIIFRLGLRVDYFDANTKVLKDPYSLYEIETAAEFSSRTGVELPESIGDDYKVYVADEGSEIVTGYRQGDTWFQPNGTSVTNGSFLFGGGIINPSYKSESDARDIKDPNFDPNISFEDYEPQLNWMPRLAFSFPISDDAGFFAHYDILVQRPPSGNDGTALDYYYFTDVSRFNPAGDPADNPNLRPEKTIDYEVGFQQKLSGSSALKVSAYYKELRDMIQRRFYNFLPAPVGEYETFGNLDFGTVKGLSFSYDLRRTGNLELKAAYTLQFADATGSDTESSEGLNEQGNIRNIFPLSYDERHRLVTTIDYRYGSGKSYNGPRIGGTDILSNTGANFIVTAVSGRPYSNYASITLPLEEQGIQAINSARLPWTYNIDFQLDKQFDFKLSKEGSKTLGLNVYFRVNNLLNTLNIVELYNITGAPDDDGYILSTFGQDRLASIAQTGRDINTFLASHQWRVLDPDFYARPRRMYIGAIVNF